MLIGGFADVENNRYAVYRSMAAPNPLARYVLALYRRGELATLEEGALIADTSRGRIAAWLEAAGIDWVRERQRFVASKRQRAQESVAGKVRKRPSKAQQRAQAQRLVEEFRSRASRRARRNPAVDS